MTMTIDGSLGVTFNDTSLQPAAASPYVLKNKIINGAMVIDQRNAGAATANTINDYTVDRWKINQSVTGKLIAQQNAAAVTPPAGYNYYLGVTSQSSYAVLAGDFYIFSQNIEGYNIGDLAWGTANAKTITISFWVRSSLTGTFGGALENSAQDRNYPFTYTISVANTWEQKSVTIAGDTSGTWLTTNGIGIRVIFGIGVGTTYSGPASAWSATQYFSATGATSVVATNGATWYVTGVQLEQNTVATPFERRIIGTEIALCQRYFCKTFEIGTAPNNNITSTGSLKGATRHGSALEPSANWKFPISMRTNPTVTLYNTGSGTAGQWSADGTATSSSTARSQWIGTEGCAMDNTGNAFNNLSNIQASATAEL